MFQAERARDRSPRAHGEPVDVSTGRLEAFSDGVIAVAITLLVLNIQVPAPPLGAGKTLAHELARNWPVYAAYVTSFLTIGIIWINHHVMIRRLREPDHMILFLNLLLLMSIAILPFATSLMATYLRESSGQHLAAVIYSGSLLVMGVVLRRAEQAHPARQAAPAPRGHPAASAGARSSPAASAV